MLRYKINILAELKRAGYSSYRLRREKKLGESTMQRLRVNSTSINLESFDVICALLNCQLGDIIEWLPDEQGDAEEGWRFSYGAGKSVPAESR